MWKPEGGVNGKAWGFLRAVTSSSTVKATLEETPAQSPDASWLKLRLLYVTTFFFSRVNLGEKKKNLATPPLTAARTIPPITSPVRPWSYYKETQTSITGINE